MAMAEERMVADFGFNPVYLRIWFKAACLIKGIIFGIIDFAGQHCLPNLPLLSANNYVTIGRAVARPSTMAQSERFRAAGWPWNVIALGGHDSAQVTANFVDTRLNLHSTYVEPPEAKMTQF
jgi:transketolase